MEERRPRLLEALNQLYDRSPRGLRHKETVAEAEPSKDRRGHVSLVGAGPGDPGLLTRRAVARLRRADLVLYDALIDPRILKLARYAQRFFVGKRAGREAMSQRVINGVMVRAARRGKQVVRLKGGDPFVFGRGGEEVSALREAGVSFEVVPGVTSAIAAPALAGIPLTHRGVSSAFLVVGGHDQEAFTRAIGKVTPNVATLVILMGVGRRVALARELIARGWAGSTPSAIVLDASRPTQDVWRGTLDEIAIERVDDEHEGAGTIVIGEVVALSAPGAGSDRFQGRAATRVYQMKRDHYGSR
jgi:uroporphyrin-III C-methyltransferase/precorrin-2 dehydrogenase/sirohydrochlorin ferrochelatase